MAARRLVIVTGISGSGKSTALKAFEDMGFLCVDNLPAPLFSHFVDFLLDPGVEVPPAPGITISGVLAPTRERAAEFALLVDCRDENAFPHVHQAWERLRAVGVDVSLIFFDCQDEVVVRRFRETRRPHPLLLSGSFLTTVADAITKERELLADFREAATSVIDTSSFTPHELRKRVEDFCGRESALKVFILSFGYKYGSPYDADLLIDVRFLPNPHFIDALRPHTGLEANVADYVFSFAEANEFVEHYLRLLDFLLPRYQKEGKRYVTIGIGCTGGRHRSVAIGAKLAEVLQAQGVSTTVRHRDIDRYKEGS